MIEERKRLIGDMREPVTRSCIECGKKFTTYRFIQKVCGPECRGIRTKRMAKEWYEENHDYVISMAKKAQINKPGKARCRLCGKIIKQAMISDHKGRVTMHDECVYNDAIKTLQSGKELSNIQKQRLRTRGFTVRELKNEVNEVEKLFGTSYYD